MAKRRMGLIAFLLCLGLCFMPISVRAASTSDATEPISTDKECSLTIGYCCDENVFSDMSVKLYKIANVSADYQYTLTSLFENTGLILNGIKTSDEWNVIRSTLESYIVADNINADFTALTDNAGKVCFESLTSGMYLAVSEQMLQENVSYSFNSVLAALPSLADNGHWQYETSVSAKAEVIPPTDKEVEYKVLKLWKGDKGRTYRPDTVEVEIFRNGVSYQTAILSEDNHWSYNWTAKDDGAKWTVTERNIPSEYRATVDVRNTSFVLTNTLKQQMSDEQSAPQTGDTLNILFYVIVMNICGILLIVLGISEKRKRI